MKRREFLKGSAVMTVAGPILAKDMVKIPEVAGPEIFSPAGVDWFKQYDVHTDCTTLILRVQDGKQMRTINAELPRGVSETLVKQQMVERMIKKQG